LGIWAAPRELSANGSTLFANGEGRGGVGIATLNQMLLIVLLDREDNMRRTGEAQNKFPNSDQKQA
jgi:hypothetical protein